MIKEIFELQNPWRATTDYQFNLKDREILKTLLDNLDNKKILGLIGSRQVGKSSLLYILIQNLIKSKVNVNHIFYFNLDDRKLHELFENIPEFLHFIGGTRENEKKFVIIDEIQRLPNPGLFLKELYDLRLNIKIIYSGSSQLEIKSKLKEFLVGRVRQLEIHRLSFDEYIRFKAPVTKGQALEETLLYGAYPEVVLQNSILERKLCIKDIYQSYVEKDLVDFLKVEDPYIFNRLLILLANQTGGLLSVDSLSKNLKIPRKQVDHYLDILEKTFITKRIYPFYRNYKKEITKTPKIYFMDLGLRNFIINNFNDLSSRNDRGQLFENFVLLEMLKDDHYSLNKVNFWRTTNQAEIDFIVSKENDTEAVEVKWDKMKSPKTFQTIKQYYPEMITGVISKDYFLKGSSGFGA
jgi:predicted AAA+ superfamily ATPase